MSYRARANADDLVDPAAAAAAVLRGRRSMTPKAGEATRCAAQFGIDHDDLLSLLHSPRPAHGDLRVLLKRRLVTRGAEGRT